MSAAAPVDLRPFEAWIVDDYLPSLRTGPGAGDYARRPGEREPALYGCADVACILYTLGRLTPTVAEAREWLDLLGSFQHAPSGLFVDGSAGLTTAHNTGFAIAAMNLLDPELKDGRRPPLPIAYAHQLAAPADAERYCAMLDWHDDCYEAGEILIGHASSFFNVEGVVPPSWFDWLVSYVEDTKLDPASGLVGTGKPPSGDLDQVGGTLHFDFLWAALGRALPYAAARADALLGLQQADGLWDDANPWWLTFDAVYMLRRTLPDAPDPGPAVAATARAVAPLAARALDEEQRISDFVEPWMGAHMLTGAVSLFTCAQQVLGPAVIVTDRPLRLVLDRRPYI